MRPDIDKLLLAVIIIGLPVCAAITGAVGYRIAEDRTDETWRQRLSDSGFIFLVRYNEINGEKIIKIERKDSK